MATPLKSSGMTFNVLIGKKEKIYVAHCLELDIVTTGTRIKDVRKEMGELIVAQVDYAFSNDNLENLFCPAPANVWKTFYNCEEQAEKRIKLNSAFKKKSMNLCPTGL
ncbi:MAG: hypothetical protein U9R02_07485 [Thermodesulfobacteriota bacterium]|nr:hypothetical protein [Thermodesulfobacteriota bacterium]